MAFLTHTTLLFFNLDAALFSYFVRDEVGGLRCLRCVNSEMIYNMQRAFMTRTLASCSYALFLLEQELGVLVPSEDVGQTVSRNVSLAKSRNLSHGRLANGSQTKAVQR